MESFESLEIAELVLLILWNDTWRGSEECEGDKTSGHMKPLTVAVTAIVPKISRKDVIEKLIFDFGY